MQLPTRSRKVAVVAAIVVLPLTACGVAADSQPMPGAGSSDATVPTIARPSGTGGTDGQSVVSPTSLAPPTGASENEDVKQYGSDEDGFVVTGSPLGLNEVPIPLVQNTGSNGHFMVNKRFTGDGRGSQINITRSTQVDVPALVDEFEAAVQEGASESRRVSVGADEQPGYLYYDELSDWHGLMWPVSETSVFYVLTKGLSDAEILEVAGAVGVVR
jgi:hypothetical protein